MLMKKKIVLVCLLFIIRAAFSQELLIEPTDPVLQAEPRQVLSASFRIVNRTNVRGEFIAHLELPAGWTLLTQPIPVMLEPNQEMIQFVHLMVSKVADAGEHRIEYRLSHNQRPELTGVAHLSVVVSQQIGLTVTRFETPEKVFAGQTYEVIFLIQNSGNSDAQIQLQISENLGYSLTPTAQRISLAAGESRQIKVTTETDKAISREVRQTIQFKATSTDGKLAASASSMVQILPRVSGQMQMYHILPGQITFRYARQERTKEPNWYQLQTEINAQGSLDEAGEHKVEVLLRAPDMQESSLVGGREEYRVSYYNQARQLHLGHHHFQLSRLTEFGRYGKGIGGSWEQNQWLLGGFWVQGEGEDLEEGALQAHYRFREHYRIGLNYLNKQETDNDENIISLTAHTEGLKSLEVFGEYAQSYSNDHWAQAYYLDLRDLKDPFGYYLTLLDADPTFGGYYQDRQSQTAGLYYHFSNGLRVRGTHRRVRSGHELEAGGRAIQREHEYRLGLDYPLSWGPQLSLEWRKEDKTSNDAQNARDEQRRTFRLRLNQSFKKFSFSGSGEWGELQDRLSETNEELYGYRLSTSFRPTRGQSYSLVGRYEKNSFDNSSSDSIALNSDIWLGKDTTLMLNLEQGHNNDRVQTRYQLKFAHKFNNAHQLALGMRHYKTADTTEKAVLLEYTVPLSIPVRRRRDVITVSGRIYDAETGKELRDVLISLSGLSAVSDKKGKFIFPAIKTGESHHLNISLAKQYLSWVPMIDMPLEIRAESLQNKQIDIPVVQGASISGQVIVYRFADTTSPRPRQLMPGLTFDGSDSTEPPRLVEEGAMANVLITLQREKEIHRRLTNRQGRFQIDGLRPGYWQIKLNSDTLSDLQRFEKEQFSLELQAGEQEELQIKVKPKIRRIKMQEQLEGGIIIE